MKNIIVKTVLSVCMMVSFFSLSQAQETNVTHNKLVKKVTHKLADYVEYPAMAAKKGIEGTVYVRFVTGEDTKIKNVRVLGKNDPALSEAVMEAVEDMAADLSPNYLAKNEVYRIPVNFTLE